MKKKGVKTNMKRKLLVFIGIITLTMNFLLIAPKINAQTNTRLIVESYNIDTGTITFYDYDTVVFFGTFNIEEIQDSTSLLPFITNKENIPLIFRLGDVYELIEQTPAYIIIEFIKPADRQIFLTLNDMVEYQVYEYKGIIDNMLIFQQGFNFYRVPMVGITFINEISGEIEFITTLKPGNQYAYITWGGTTIEFHLTSSPDYEYFRGYRRGQSESSNDASKAFQEGYEAGSKLAEGLLESEYLRGEQNGYNIGYNNGYNQGYNNGFNNAYEEIITSDEYTLGYENGFKAGEKSKLVQNNESFYNGIEKWLVPAIITVIVLGGIVSITALKRREL